MKLTFDTDQGIGTRANLGVIVLENDTTLEHEFRSLMNIDGVALYHSRIPMGPDIRPDTLPQMLDDLPAAARLLPPALDFDVIGYGCTSATSVIGPEKVATAIQTVCPSARVTDPLSAIIAAGRHIGVTRLGFLSPYVAEVSQTMRDRLTEAGFQIAGFGSFEESNDQIVGRITPASILTAARQIADAAPCDAIVISCTALRCLDIIPEIEAQTGKPVLASNPALAWHMLRLANMDDPRPGLGRLFG
ncbi:Asp/Glu racemase [Aliiroseovarius sp. F47248L]|uniref:maleate cis-trans isomerase family protein n=1 Tax=Aliiroseovarius sp. F47248L TaxID=2926420 RepID=UPI001FF4CAA9|nr:Asp/Glu racemase [Aliiroseovarius sp. F47248L]MCK0140511.1 Asp/Glu racemase [Aliiroseovarius sp. F47248L]